MSYTFEGEIVSVDSGMELVTINESLKWGMKSWKYVYDDEPWFLIDIHFRLAGVQETLYIREKSRNATYLTERLVTLLMDEDARVEAAMTFRDKYHTEARSVTPRVGNQFITHGGTPGGTFQAPE